MWTGYVCTINWKRKSYKSYSFLFQPEYILEWSQGNDVIWLNLFDQNFLTKEGSEGHYLSQDILSLITCELFKTKFYFAHSSGDEVATDIFPLVFTACVHKYLASHMTVILHLGNCVLMIAECWIWL